MSKNLQRLGGQQINQQIDLKFNDTICLPINYHKKKEEKKHIFYFLKFGILYRALLLKEDNIV